MQQLQVSVVVSSQRRNIDDLLTSGPSSGMQPEARSLITWIVMDYCERGPLSGIAVRMVDDSLAVKLVGGGGCLVIPGHACW
jgi:hypothetical protein